jgi:predicted RNase H-like HicB family nuclease
MPSLRYTVIFEPGELAGYHAFVPALKGCHSYGDTLEEARLHVQEAIEVYLDELRSRGQEPPLERYVINDVEVAA